MKKGNRIYLVGFMGTGKSTVAVELARKLDYKLWELDEIIREAVGISIPQIFESMGETFFREKESEALKKTSNLEDLVVSCGGGIVLSEDNTKFMQCSGVIVLLKAAPETIYKRIREQKSRPVLSGKMTVEGIATVLDSRREAYEKSAQIIVDTDDKNILDIVDEIIVKIKKGNFYG